MSNLVCMWLLKFFNVLALEQIQYSYLSYKSIVYPSSRQFTPSLHRLTIWNTPYQRPLPLYNTTSSILVAMDDRSICHVTLSIPLHLHFQFSRHASCRRPVPFISTQSLSIPSHLHYCFTSLHSLSLPLLLHSTPLHSHHSPLHLISTTPSLHSHHSPLPLASTITPSPLLLHLLCYRRQIVNIFPNDSKPRRHCLHCIVVGLSHSLTR